MPGLEDRHPDQQGHPRAARAHDGYGMIYVLSGTCGFILGDQDQVLGQATRPHRHPVPHWFGSTGDETGGDPQHLRTARPTDDRPNNISAKLRADAPICNASAVELEAPRSLQICPVSGVRRNGVPQAR